MGTEVTSISWFGRIRESIKSFVVGLGFFVASFPLLWWNEGRAVRTEKSLNEGAGAVISVGADRIDPANNLKLVHVSGPASTGETLTDPEFLIAARAIKLRRSVEMYQWDEKQETTTRKKVGGGEERVTTYSYSKTWSDHPIDSGSFHEAEGHRNPGEMPYQGHEAQAEHVTLGAFTLTSSLLSQLNEFETVPVTSEQMSALPGPMKTKFKLHNNGLYAGADPQAPQIGDARISFSAVKPAEVSVVSKQSGTTFEPYRASAGMDIEMLKRGVFTAQAMFESALRQNSVMTWLLRLAGFFLMFLGLVMFFRPISVLGDLIPMVGSMLAFGTGLFALAVAGVLSLGTIGVAWVVYRPLMGISLLSLAIAVLLWLVISGKKRVAATAIGPAPAAS